GVIKPPLKIHLLYYMYNCKWKDSFDFLVTSNCINISQENSGKFRKNGKSKYVIKQKLETSVTDTLSYFKDVIVFVAVTGTPTIAKRKGWTNTVGFDIPLVL
ncbi:hypothetical protein, partial [Clostridium sp.]|uniref:hypothetical protein n=1 Tax=Clostridium sp. TaxID=1506 RepID=UPI002847F741